MNKKEISEIKKQLTPANCNITRICGCYVDAEKNKKTELKEVFLSLSEEEMFKYFEIFKKTLSGTLGKNLMNMEFPLAEEKEGGKHEFLMKLRASKLKDDALIESFYDKIIENYDYPENYYIILVHAVYDIPGRTSDGIDMDDASEEIYEHLASGNLASTLSGMVNGLSVSGGDARPGENARINIRQNDVLSDIGGTASEPLYVIDGYIYPVEVKIGDVTENLSRARYTSPPSRPPACTQ